MKTATKKSTAKKATATKTVATVKAAVKNIEAKAPAKKKAVKKYKDGKDHSKFIFNGKQYGKGRFADALIKQYLTDKPATTLADLEKVFPNTLCPSGLFQPINVAKMMSKKYVRYYIDEPIKLEGKKMAVCSQFGKENIKPVVKIAHKLGYDVKIVA